MKEGDWLFKGAQGETLVYRQTSSGPYPWWIGSGLVNYYETILRRRFWCLN